MSDIEGDGIVLKNTNLNNVTINEGDLYTRFVFEREGTITLPDGSSYLSQEELVDVCTKSSVAENAKDYNRETSDLHPMVVFLREEGGEYRQYTSDEHASFAQTAFKSESWTARAGNEAELVLCMENRKQLIESCPYNVLVPGEIKSVTVERYIQSTELKIYEAKTGKLLDSTLHTNRNKPSTCTSDSEFRASTAEIENGLKQVLPEEPDSETEEVTNWLSQYVESAN